MGGNAVGGQRALRDLYALHHRAVMGLIDERALTLVEEGERLLELWRKRAQQQQSASRTGAGCALARVGDLRTRDLLYRESERSQSGSLGTRMGARSPSDYTVAVVAYAQSTSVGVSPSVRAPRALTSWSAMVCV